MANTELLNKIANFLMEKETLKQFSIYNGIYEEPANVEAAVKYVQTLIRGKVEDIVREKEEIREAEIALVLVPSGAVEAAEPMAAAERMPMVSASSRAPLSSRELLGRMQKKLAAQTPSQRALAEDFRRRYVTDGNGMFGGKKRKSKKVRKSRIGRFPHKRKSKKARKSKKR